MKLKENLTKKLKKSGGFTLIEMLIVVAIIAILVAVSIPMVNSNLEKAREATDEANLRAAKMVAMVSTLGSSDGVVTDTATDDTYFYDVSKGKLSNAAATELDADDKPQSSKYTETDNNAIIVVIASGNVSSVSWGKYTG